MVRESGRVSVLMSAYNCEKTVGEAIESILNQTYSNFEYLIADDGSIDDTRTIIDSYASHDRRIRCFHNSQNIGLLDTWNGLLSQVTGDLITWQDGDDYSYPERLERLVRAFMSDPDLMICGTNYSRVLDPWGIKIVSSYPTEYEHLLHGIRNQNKLFFLGGTRMIRSELLTEFPRFRAFFDRIGWEDHDFILRVADKYKVKNLPDVLYDYRYSRDSASRRLTEDIYLKLFAEDIGFFLAKQRWREGRDGLMEGGNRSEFDAYLENLKAAFEKDKSILYRHACINKVNNKDYVFAIKDAIQAILTSPTNARNYSLLFRIVGSLSLTLYRIIIRQYERV